MFATLRRVPVVGRRNFNTKLFPIDSHKDIVAAISSTRLSTHYDELAFSQRITERSAVLNLPLVSLMPHLSAPRLGARYYRHRVVTLLSYGGVLKDTDDLVPLLLGTTEASQRVNAKLNVTRLLTRRQDFIALVHLVGLEELLIKMVHHAPHPLVGLEAFLELLLDGARHFRFDDPYLFFCKRVAEEVFSAPNLDLRSARLDLQSARLDLQSARLDLQSARLDLRSARLDLRSVRLDLEVAKKAIRSLVACSNASPRRIANYLMTTDNLGPLKCLL